MKELVEVVLEKKAKVSITDLQKFTVNDFKKCFEIIEEYLDISSDIDLIDDGDEISIAIAIDPYIQNKKRKEIEKKIETLKNNIQEDFQKIKEKIKEKYRKATKAFSLIKLAKQISSKNFRPSNWGRKIDEKRPALHFEVVCSDVVNDILEKNNIDWDEYVPVSYDVPPPKFNCIFGYDIFSNHFHMKTGKNVVKKLLGSFEIHDGNLSFEKNTLGEYLTENGFVYEKLF